MATQQRMLELINKAKAELNARTTEDSVLRVDVSDDFCAILFLMDKDALDRLDEYLNRSGRTLDDMINEAIEEYMDNRPL